MSTPAVSTPRTEFFQKLKRVCVPLNQLAVRSQDKTADAKEILQHVESLIQLWSTQAAQDDSILDDRLADYVFVPLSQVLRDRDQYPMRVVEGIICLLRELIQHGWKVKTSAALFRQLLILLSFTIGGVPGQARKKDIPEETIAEAFKTLGALITSVDPSRLERSDTPGEDSIPALGHSVTVMIDAVTEDVPSQIQLEAVACLRAVFTSAQDNPVLAQFLPGTVSGLSKRLSPPLEKQSQKRVLVVCLEALQLVLVNVLGDIKVRGLLRQIETEKDPGEEPKVESDAESTAVELTPSWLKATAAQVKIALSAVLKLRSHESEEIQRALYRLCITLLDECHASLADCQSILVETALMLQEDEAPQSRLETSLQDLVSIYPELSSSIKSALYSWVTGLPRMMQSSNEKTKQLAIRSILRGSKLAAAVHMDSSILDDSLADSLRDSIITLMKASKPPKVIDDVGAIDLSQSTALIKSGNTELATYNPVILDSEGQKTTRNELSTLISQIGSPDLQVKLATSMLSYVRDSEEPTTQIASFWLAFELLKSTYSQSADLDELFDFSSLGETQLQDQAFQELYDFSTSILVSHSDSIESPWQLEALALEVTAFFSTRLKLDFRPELIDVLYPVTTFLGSSEPQLRRHAITTLNILATSCGYDSVSELIVDNADYMLNSVSLRLNTFDISPASTRVLTMMIRLTGPKLVPFLDDTVQAIFAALDNYHGYPVFVESLFSVLSEIVTQGVKSDLLLPSSTTTKPTIDHKKKSYPPQGIPAILSTVTKHLARAQQSKSEAEQPFQPATPHEPWGPPKSTPKTKSFLEELDSPSSPSENTEPPTAEEKEEKELQTPTYNLLTKILTLTQHHLTSPTPTLRKSLLDLISTVTPALSPSENSFLPLVNLIWPVLITRLHDAEPFVAISAANALEELCKAAGDFMGSRFATVWREKQQGLKGWVGRVKGDAFNTRSNTRSNTRGAGRGLIGNAGGSNRRGSGIMIPSSSPSPSSSVAKGGLFSLDFGSATTTTPGEGMKMVSSSSYSAPTAALGRFSQPTQLWEAAVSLLAAIVTYVKVGDEMFDEILELVVDVLPRYPELKEAMEVVNGDAVWLGLYQRGLVELNVQAPVMEGFRFASLPVR
ncbi:armadillo-type protein [Triangularia verruculosa]|uniref:Armadillo-type protein n=1 Tax=Triangularia verruculosa TaxID=2587418 RepID=A0AAN7APV6_9PEZI|nr:armadillo-type protein [Triangularia verruculosa]